MKTIEEIRGLRTEEAADYVRVLAEANPDLDQNDIINVLVAIRSSEYINPIPDEVLTYIISMLVENYNDVSFQFFPPNVVIDSESHRIFKWFFERNSPHYLLLTNSQKERLESSLILADAGEVSSFVRTSALDINSSHVPFLRLLGVDLPEDITIIPEVPMETGVAENVSRFSSAMWFDEVSRLRVLLAGCGGIGSFTAFMLARINIDHLVLFDPDTVEEANMSGQLFRYNNVGESKVTALYRTITEYSQFYSISTHSARYDIHSAASKIMISGFDNMEARRVFFYSWLRAVENAPIEERKEFLLIDGRLAAEELQVFCIRGDDGYNIQRYSDEFLFSSEEAEETVCSYKQTTFMANMIGSIIANLVVNFAANKVIEGIRDLPFLTTYDAAGMMFKTEN